MGLPGRTAAPARPPWHHPWPFLGSPSWQSHVSCLGRRIYRSSNFQAFRPTLLWLIDPNTVFEMEGSGWSSVVKSTGPTSPWGWLFAPSSSQSILGVNLSGGPSDVRRSQGGSFSSADLPDQKQGVLWDRTSEKRSLSGNRCVLFLGEMGRKTMEHSMAMRRRHTKRGRSLFSATLKLIRNSSTTQN